MNEQKCIGLIITKICGQSMFPYWSSNYSTIWSMPVSCSTILVGYASMIYRLLVSQEIGMFMIIRGWLIQEMV